MHVNKNYVELKLGWTGFIEKTLNAYKLEFEWRGSTAKETN